MQLCGVVNWLVGFAVEGIMHIFKTWINILNTWWGRSLGRYDDGLQKPIMCEEVESVIKADNDRLLEQSSSPDGETRRSTVQIRAAPPQPKILNVLVRMEADGQSTYSKNRTRKILEQLSQYTNLNNPEEAKAYIANHKVTSATKKHMVYAYDKYARYYGIQWTKPKYKPQSKAVKVPTKEKVETLTHISKRNCS